MAGLRLIAVAALVSLGCHGSADAPPAPAATGSATSGLAAPAGWIPLPAIAAATADAARAPGVIIDGAQAWGEPAMGCYATWIRLHGGDPAMAAQVVTGFGSGAGAVTATVDGALVSFTRGAYHGRLQLRGDDALACFANQREPAACDAACTALFAGVHS